MDISIEDESVLLHLSSKLEKENLRKRIKEILGEKNKESVFFLFSKQA